ncbi:MAG TPA: hypothetical protein VEQ63_10190 [Bryobacteraceae bacterium]|nr:hypothetical protein [Bryobacteraceae bacterium]
MRSPEHTSAAETTIVAERPDDPALWMECTLNEWLDQTNWEEQRQNLTNWLRGYALPPVGSDEEPYAWLLYGLGQSSGRPERQRRFAELLVRFLNEHPDVEFTFPNYDGALCNLLLLAAGLDWAELLADPVDRMLARERERKAMSLQVREALRVALVRTQIDNRHHQIWREMLRTGTHDLLPGNEFSGFSGVKWMPQSPEMLGQPNCPALAEALLLLWIKVPQHQKRVVLASSLDEVQRLYPDKSELVLSIVDETRKLTGKLPFAVPPLLLRAYREALDRMLQVVVEVNENSLTATVSNGVIEFRPSGGSNAAVHAVAHRFQTGVQRVVADKHAGVSVVANSPRQLKGTLDSVKDEVKTQLSLESILVKFKAAAATGP